MAKKTKEDVEGIIADAINLGEGDGDLLFPNGLLGEMTIIEDDDTEDDDDDADENTDDNSTSDDDADLNALKPNATTTDKDGDTEESPIKILANYLRDEGIVDYKDEDFRDEEDFINEVIENRIDEGVSTYKETLPDVIKDLIENYEEGVPLAELLGMKTNNENYLKMTKESLSDNETLQKTVIREHYKRLNYKEEKIQAKIERLESRGELEEESIESLEELKELLGEEEVNYKEQTKKAELARMQQYEAAKIGFKETLSKRDEIFKGLPLTTKQKDTLFNGIFVADKDGKNELTKRVEQNPDHNLQVAYMALVLNWDLSALDKIANTKAAKGLRAAIESNKSRLGGQGVQANSSLGMKFDPSVAQQALGKRK